MYNNLSIRIYKNKFIYIRICNTVVLLVDAKIVGWVCVEYLVRIHSVLTLIIRIHSVLIKVTSIILCIEKLSIAIQM